MGVFLGPSTGYECAPGRDLSADIGVFCARNVVQTLPDRKQAINVATDSLMVDPTDWPYIPTQVCYCDNVGTHQ